MNDLETRLRETFEQMAETTKFRRRADEILVARRRRESPRFMVAVAGFVTAAALIGLPALLSSADNEIASDGQKGSPASSPDEPKGATSEGWVEPTVPESQLEEGGPVPQAARDYWAMEGTLESIGSEPAWLCPRRPNSGYAFPLSATDTPPELEFELPGQTPVRSSTTDMGPTCEQPAALIMMAFTDESHLEATAGASVWPSLTRLEDVCPPQSCSMDGRVDHSAGLTINDQPARLFEYLGNYEVWWVDPHDVPLHGFFSGLSKEDAIDLASSVLVDPVSHLANTPTSLPAELTVLVAEPSVGRWTAAVSHEKTYEIEGTNVHVSSRFASETGEASTPYTRLSFNVEFPDLVDLGNTTGLWIPEGGNFLIFDTANGVKVTIEGAKSIDQAVNIANDLEFP